MSAFIPLTMIVSMTMLGILLGVMLLSVAIWIGNVTGSDWYSFFFGCLVAMTPGVIIFLVWRAEDRVEQAEKVYREMDV